MDLLVVSANRGVAALARRAVPGASVRAVATLRRALEEAGRAHALVLDPHLPDAQGPDAVTRLRAACPAPMVVLADGDAAIRALSAGAEETLAKDDLGRLAAAIRAAGERARAEAVLRDAAAESVARERIERLEDELVNAVAHELSTPLTPISLRLRVLRKALGEGDPDAMRHVEALEASAERLERCVQDLIGATRVRARLGSIRPEVVDLADVVAAAIERAGPARSSFHRTGQGPFLCRIDAEPLTDALAPLLAARGGQVAQAALLGTDAHVVLRITGRPAEDGRPLSAPYGERLLDAVVAAHGGRIRHDEGEHSTTLLLPRVRPGVLEAEEAAARGATGPVAGTGRAALPPPAERPQRPPRRPGPPGRAEEAAPTSPEVARVAPGATSGPSPTENEQA